MLPDRLTLKVLRKQSGHVKLEVKVVLGLLVAALAAALVPSSAWAAPATENMFPSSNWNKTCFDTSFGRGMNCQTDDDSVGWRAEGSIDSTTNTSDTPAERWINVTMADSYDTTDLAVYFDTSPKYDGSGETDVIYRAKASDFAGTDFIGMTWCDDAVSSLRCDQQYVQFEDAYATDRALACHETGHSVGLLHGENAAPRFDNQDSRLGCMVKRIVSSLKFVGANNVSNINATYT